MAYDQEAALVMYEFAQLRRLSARPSDPIPICGFRHRQRAFIAGARRPFVSLTGALRSVPLGDEPESGSRVDYAAPQGREAGKVCD